MKIRTGFVSNSSSSSFVLIGKRLSGIMEVLSLTPEEQGKVRIISSRGYEYDEEGELTQEILEDMLLYEPWEINEVFSFWYAQFTSWEDGGAGKVTEDINIGADVFSGTISMHCSWEMYKKDSFHKWMHDLGYGDQTSEEEKRLEEILNEN